MKKSNKGFVPIMVRPETKLLVKAMMPSYDDTYDGAINVLIGNHGDLKKALEEIERLKREIYKFKHSEPFALPEETIKGGK